MWFLRELQRAFGFGERPNGSGLQSGSLAASLDRIARRHPQKPAFRIGEQMISHREFAAARHRFARWIRSQSLQPGDSIAIVTQDRILALTGIAAASTIGTSVAAPDPRLPSQTLRAAIARASAQILIIDPDLWPLNASASDHERRLSIFLTGPTHHRGCATAQRLDLALPGYSVHGIPPTELPSLSSKSALFHVFGVDGAASAVMRTLTHARMDAEMTALTLIGRSGDLDLDSFPDCSDEMITQAFHALGAGCCCLTRSNSPSGERTFLLDALPPNRLQA